jgi:DNA-binding PadR family transcriptional regulator
MTLPETDRFRVPTLRALSGGSPTTSKPVHDRVQAILQISDEDRAYIPPTSNNSTFTNRVAWAFVDLQRRGLIEKTRTDPNTYKITTAGEQALTDGLDLSAISLRVQPPGPGRSEADGEGGELPPDVLEEPEPLPYRTRAFDPARPPQQSDFRWIDLDQEAKHQLLEKARQGHHQILVDLARWLEESGWLRIGEIPGSIDLWAVSPGGRRWLFEAKTVRDDNQLSQTRSALAQLLEYRATHGTEKDGLCIALDRPVPSVRSDLLGRLGITLVQIRDRAVECLNEPAREITG